MKPIEISRGLYLFHTKRYQFYVDRQRHEGVFVAQEQKEFVFSNVVRYIPKAWSTGHDDIEVEVGTLKLSGRSICELVQLD